MCCCCADITVPANITSYTLRSLSGNTKYDTWIVASTIKGSARGFNHSFTTQKYGEHRPPTPVASLKMSRRPHIWRTEHLHCSRGDFVFYSHFQHKQIDSLNTFHVRRMCWLNSALSSAAAGEIEAIVVGISLLFFFIVLIIMLVCIYKEDM